MQVYIGMVKLDPNYIFFTYISFGKRGGRVEREEEEGIILSFLVFQLFNIVTDIGFQYLEAQF